MVREPCLEINVSLWPQLGPKIRTRVKVASPNVSGQINFKGSKAQIDIHSDPIR